MNLKTKYSCFKFKISLRKIKLFKKFYNDPESQLEVRIRIRKIEHRSFHLHLKNSKEYV